MTEELLDLVKIVIVASIFIPVLGSITTQIGEHDHPGYESTIEQKESTIQSLRSRVNSLESRNENISQKYERLVEENVTKKDVEEIERELNQTSTEVEILNKRFETVNQKFISSYQKTVNQYQLWMSVSLFSISFLALDVIAGAFFGGSFTSRISKYLQKISETVKRKYESFGDE